MAGFPLPFVKPQFVDQNGNPFAGGKLYSFAGGTSTPLATFADEALTTPNANPVILDSSGRATIFVEDGTYYKFRLDDSADVTQWTVDNIAVPEPIAPVVPASVPTGAILAFGGTVAPSGFLMCDGSAVSRATFAALFTAIGTVYGAGDGSTTFNLPDQRGRFPFGKAAAGTGSVLGGTFGAIDHVHTGPSHTHNVTIPRDGWSFNQNTPAVTGRIRTGDAAGAGPEATAAQATGDQTVASAAGGTGNTGTSNPPGLAHNHIIKT